MKYLITLACLLVAVSADEKYTDKYDNINLQEILHNERLLNAYIDCILEKGKCTPEGKTLKDNLQDALETGCAKCTDRQEEGTYTAIEFLIKEKLSVWNELTNRFDPDGKWRKTYEDRAKAKGIEIPK